jgi:hypothetical protein
MDIPVTSKKTNLTAYERKAKSLKKYLNNRYDTDEEFRNKINERRRKAQQLRYATDVDYREAVLLKAKLKREAQKIIKEQNKLTK